MSRFQPGNFIFYLLIQPAVLVIFLWLTGYSGLSAGMIGGAAVGWIMGWTHRSLEE